MSVRHPQTVFIDVRHHGDEHAWGGIRDGGRRGRRSGMYEFLRMHPNGRSFTPGTAAYQFYMECQAYARSLSVTKSQRNSEKNFK